MRNGMNTKPVQLGQYVSARSDIWKSARKILVLLSSCSSSRSRGLAHADECACAYYVQLCAFVKRISEDLCDQTEAAESCSLVLVCSICTFDILSCLRKEYSYSAFPCILILVMAEKRLKQHVDHRGMLNPPHWNPKYKVILASFGRETPGCICAFASGIKWEIKRAKTMKFDVCFLQLRSKRNLWSGHWLVDVSTVTFTAGTCISCCPRARCPWRCNTADEGPDLLSLLAWQETSSWRGKKKKKKRKSNT